MKQDFYSQHANTNWRTSRAVCAPLLRAVLLLGVALAAPMAHGAIHYQRLKSFESVPDDGALPRAGLVQGSDGALYGTTGFGGNRGGGTVFKISSDGSGYRVLHHFIIYGGEGYQPLEVVEGSDGALYGTTGFGGNGGCINDNKLGCGTVFRLNKDGSGYSNLHHFSSTGDGQIPSAGLVEGSDGALYGTTVGGGSNDVGTIFKLNKDGSDYSVLRNFGSNVGDGALPQAGLVEGSDGALYGTTADGGTNNGGTVFKLNKEGSGYTVLHIFSTSSGDGQNPIAALVEASDGALYGTTLFGGTTEGAGTVFKLNKDGSTYNVLHNFNPFVGEGYNPFAALVEGSDGALYGTTSNGGSNNGGTVFKLNRDGSDYDVLRSFSSTGGDGQYPSSELVEGSEGTFFGTTRGGGDLGFGTVFKLFASTPIVVITRIELDGAGARLNLSGGAAGQTFQIQSTPNLTTPSWQSIGTNQFGIDGKLMFLDTSASNYPARFYRSATP